MRRGIQRVSAGGFALSLSALIPFWVEAGTAPSGRGAMWMLYGALGACVAIWLIATFTTPAVQRWQRRNKRPARLAEECRGFADELSAFVDARRHGRPVFPRRDRSAATTIADFLGHNPELERERATVRTYNGETLSRYHEQFRVRAVRLFDRVRAVTELDAAERDALSTPREVDDLAGISAKMRDYAQRLSRSRAS